MNLLSLLLLVLLLIFIFVFRKNETKPGYTNYPILGTLPSFVLNRHRFLDWTTTILQRCPTNTSFFSRPGGVHGIVTANPANIEHMLKTNFENYPKGLKFIALLEDFLGRGIFNSDGELWKVQRKTASYEFNTKSLRVFVMEVAVIELHRRLVPFLAHAANTGRVIDMQDVLERFAFDNICKVAFNVDPGCLSVDGTVESNFMQAFEEAATLSSQRFMQIIPTLHLLKKYCNIGSEKRLQRSITIVHQFADKIIKSRMEERLEKRDEDLLSRFIGSGSQNSVEFLRDIVISFILAGRDTTSSALTWFFWKLSSAPDVEKNILKELRSIRTKKQKNMGDTYSFDELREMTYLHAAISESMRLYPPVPIDTKACLEDDIMPDGTFVGKGWVVSYSAYSMGRLVDIWGEDCCEFKPERWIKDGTCIQISPYRYPVFHAGPRICLGKDMAYIQMKSIVASVLERFVIEVPDKDTDPEHVLSLTLRMKGGLLVKVRERCNLVT